MIETEYTYEDMRIYGVIGKPEIARSNRANQIFFVNKRFIKDKEMLQNILSKKENKGKKIYLEIGMGKGDFISRLASLDLDNIYIGVVTDGALELKAESIEAAIVPPADCLAAKKIVSGEEYVQNPGAQWYQFPMSLIDEMGGAAKISFKNLTSNHATLSAGVTVGCEYAIAHRAKVKVPKKKLTSYKKQLRKAGLNKKVKVTR